AGEGLRRCLNAVNALPQRVEFVITGGDLIMDALEVDNDRLKVQWDLFDECWKNLEAPAYHTLGNHDVGGWSAKGQIQPAAYEYGKKLFSDRYGKGRTYSSWDHGGWHFVSLDSIGQNTATLDYYGWVDEEQQEWLKNDLAHVGTSVPVCLVTHIPLYSVWGQMNGDPRQGENAKSLINNAHILRKLLARFNVKLVLCGHGHVVERIQFGHTTYIQGGAVSGLWWKGPSVGNPEGYGVVTCRSDGSFDYDYCGYGWQAVK
ncbi:MAG: metallophosphoesterase family protein, partial [Roseimicrobium sp.]